MEKDRYNAKTGLSFNELFVNYLSAIRLSEKRGKRNEVYWGCLYKCGKELLVRSDALRKGSIKYCGCIKRLNNKHSRCWKGHGDIGGNFWSSIQRNAYYRKIEFKISIEEAWGKFLE